MSDELVSCPACGSQNLYYGHRTAMKMGVQCFNCTFEVCLRIPSEWPDSVEGEPDEVTFDDLEELALELVKEIWNNSFRGEPVAVEGEQDDNE